MVDTIVLDGEDFIICYECDINNNHYIYATSVENDYDVFLVEIIEGDNKFVESVKDESIKEQIILKMGESLKNSN